MKSIADRLFLVWIFSFPFYHYSVVGTLSVDNLLTPLLVLSIPFLRLNPEGSLSGGGLLWIGLALFTYFAPQVIPLVVTEGIVWKVIYDLFVDSAYFLVALVFLGGRPWLRSKAENLVVVIAMIGCVTAFLAAIGVLELSVSRYSSSRLGIEGLQRTVGLFGVYGDMAILCSFSLLYALSREEMLAFFRKRKPVVVAVFLIVLLGLLGSQSRNMVLTITVSLGFFWLIKRAARKGRQALKRVLYQFTIAGILMGGLLTVYGREMMELLSQWGGQQAQGTATARLSQYHLAWSLLKDSWLIGVSAETFERYSADIAYIHNMWLKEAVKGGVLGVMGLGALFIMGARRAISRLMVSPDDDIARRNLATLLAIFVSTQFNPSGTFIFWFMLGLSLSYVGQQNSKVGANGHERREWSSPLRKNKISRRELRPVS